MRKNYWKECCLLLIGLILGCLYQEHSSSLPVKNTTIILRDTIRDTVYAEPIIPKLSKNSVYLELKKQNIPHPHIVLAQSILETGNYTSKLTKSHNNIFGLRKGNKYRRYDNFIECIADYKRFISSRYSGGDYYAFLERIGYAEDPQYTLLLKNIVKKNNLI